MRRQTLVLTTPMHELIRLIEKIDTVLKDYLRQRFGVTSKVLNEQPIENIIVKLSRNTNYYRNLEAATQVPAEVSTFSSVTKALVSGVHYLDSTVRYYTNTDGAYRLETLAWLCWSLRNFQQCLSQYEQLAAATDPKALQATLATETRSFFDAVTRILDHTPPDTKSVFKLAREGKIFRIYGLKNDPSELGRLLRVHVLEEFNCQTLIDKMLSDIDRHTKSLAKEYNERINEKKQYQASIQQLEKSNADLLRQLENSHNSVRQLQGELQNSRDRTQALDSELRIKTFQENTFERRIEKLEKEKSLLEKKQSQLDKGSSNVRVLQQNIEEMRSALAEAERKREEVVNERKVLVSQVHTEQQRQQALQQQLTDAHDENFTLADELQQPAASINESAAGENEDEDDDFNIDKLTAALREAEACRVINSSHDKLSGSQNTIERGNEKKQFPFFDEEAVNGLTSAQVHVIEGKPKHLRALLKRDPDIVNTICHVNGQNLISKKTLLELTLFHSKAPVKARIETLELILQYRPNIMAANPCVLFDVINRINAEGCNAELSDMFCQYAIAQKTCSQEARAEMKKMMSEIDTLYNALQESPCKILLLELAGPLNVCRALEQGYINGSFSKLDPLITHEKNSDNAAAYEILYDLNQKLEAEEKYQRKYGVPLLRRRLVDNLSSAIRICHSLMPGQSIISRRTDTIVDLDANEAMKINPSQHLSAPVQKSSALQNSFNVEQVKQYSELVNNITRIIERYGVVLNTRGFNPYQRSEIALRIQSEALEVAVQLTPGENHTMQFN